MNQQQQDRREMTLKAKLSVPEAAAPPWGILGAASSLIAMFISMTLIGPGLASLLLGRQDAEPLLLMLGWAIGLVATAAFVLISRRNSDSSWQALRLQKGSLPLPMVLLIGVAIALAIDLFISLASGQFLPVPQIYGFQFHGLPGAIVAALLMILLQPVAETLVFQAVILPALRWTLGPWRGLITTCLLFVLFHALVYYAPYQSAYEGIWYGLAYPLFSCLAFSLLKVFSDSSQTVLIARVSAGLIALLTAMALTGI